MKVEPTLKMDTIKERIAHPGIVERIDNQRVFVRIESATACGSCHSKTQCGMAGLQEKVVEVDRPGNEDLKKGQAVLVTLEQSLGFRALFLGYLLPFMIMLAGILVLIQLTGNELLSGLGGIGLLVPYYLWLYISRNKLRKQFRFTIQQTQ